MDAKAINESEQLKKLYRYNILNAAPEESFDKIAQLAATVYGGKGAVICFLNSGDCFFKSTVNIDFNINDVGIRVFFRSIIQANKIFAKDLQSPFETIPANCNSAIATAIDLLASIPLRTSNGNAIGVLCVFGSKQAKFEDSRFTVLTTLASIIMDKLAFRISRGNAIRAQSDLINIAIHDMKNPLTSIRLYAQLMQRETSDDTLKTLHAMAGKILKSTEQLLSNLNDLINVSQIDDGAMKLDMKPCKLQGILDDLINDYQIVFEQKGQTIVYKSNLEKYVLADQGRLREVFDNLLSNAAKYAYPGGKIMVIASEEDSWAKVEFRDDGQGLSEDDKRKIFTKFAKLSSVPTGKESSNGLGLSIAKILVELHNGKISAESEGKNRGTSFFVRIPLVS